MSVAPLQRKVSFSQQIANFGAQLGRRLSPSSSREADEAANYSATSSKELLGDSDSATIASAQTRSSSRSVSRGRDAFMSSGRGGLGNIRKTQEQPETLHSRDPNDPDYISPVRGREAVKRVEQPDQQKPRLVSVGRGGLGNFRSSSNDAVTTTEQSAIEYEKTVIQASTEAARTGSHSYGRGGLGNIRSPSASQVPTTATVTEQNASASAKTPSLLEKARALSRSRSRAPNRS